jgi:nitrilase
MSASKVRVAAVQAAPVFLNTILYFDDTGRLLGKHRQLMPTHAERLVWGMGDGSDRTVHQTTVGRWAG